MTCECGRSAVARGLCNAHYLRWRQGREMKSPVRERGGVCVIDGKQNYAYHLCLKHYKAYRWWIIKTRLVRLLGGQCRKCLLKFPLAVFDFHHRNPERKKFSIGYEIQNKSWGELKAEALKCDLLCANCHRLVEYDGGIKWQSLNLQSPQF